VSEPQDDPNPKPEKDREDDAPDRTPPRSRSGAAGTRAGRAVRSRSVTGVRSALESGGVLWTEYAKNAVDLPRCLPKSSARSRAREAARHTKRGLRTSGRPMRPGPLAAKADRSAGVDAAVSSRRPPTAARRQLPTPGRTPADSTDTDARAIRLRGFAATARQVADATLIGRGVAFLCRRSRPAVHRYRTCSVVSRRRQS
jgi:hypothetical protein